MIILNSKDAQNLIEQSTNNIDYILKELKRLDGLTKGAYEALGVLDDLVIEFEDLHRSFLQQQKAYNKLRLNKNVAFTEHIDYNENKKEGI